MACILAEPDDAEQWLSGVMTEFLNVGKSANIYSRFQAKERELQLWKEKYLECSLALIESQHQTETMHKLLLQKEFQIANDRPCIKHDSHTPIRSSVEEDCGSLPSKLRDVMHKVQNEENGSKTIQAQVYQLSHDLAKSTTVPGFQNPSECDKKVTDGAKDSIEMKNSSTNLVSVDLLQKVMQQNKRLKTAIRSIIESQGSTVQDVMELQDNRKMIDQLTCEVNNLRSRIAGMESLNASSDDELRRQCSQLTSQVHSLKHVATVRQAMVDVCSTELHKLKQQIHNGHDSESIQQAMVADVNLLTKKTVDDVLRLRAKYADMENIYKVKAETFDQLKKNVADLENQNEKLKSDLKRARPDLQQTTELNKPTPLMLNVATVLRPITAAGSCYAAEAAGYVQPSSVRPLVAATDDGVTGQSSEMSQSVAPDSAAHPTDQFVCQRCENRFADKESLSMHQVKCCDD